MTKCHGCNRPIEPLAAIRTYHGGCDPWGRMERLEKALRKARRGMATEIRRGLGVFAESELAEIDAALARPAQRKGRE